jgi:precorrin-6B methylase 2
MITNQTTSTSLSTSNRFSNRVDSTIAYHKRNRFLPHRWDSSLLLLHKLVGGMGPSKRKRVKAEESVEVEDILYSSQEYWEGRYQAPEGFHEWYCSYENLKPLLEMHISSSDSVLEIGCGDSPLVTGMLSGGHSGKLHAIDFSESIIRKVIDDQTKTGVSSSKIDYLEMDARKLTYESDSWDAVIDKGTLDAMLCDKKTGLTNAKELISEACRVLQKSSGVLVFISHIQVETVEFDDWMQNCVLPVLDDHRSYLWTVEAHTGRGRVGETESPTVFIISSKPRRFTRGSLSTGVVEMKVLSHSDDEEDEGNEED